MNAAEITDKLGLHSLRQRAWVSYNLTHDWNLAADLIPSTFNQLAPPPATVSTKGWNG